MGFVQRRSVIEGVGSYLPARIMSNADLARMVDTSSSCDQLRRSLFRIKRSSSAHTDRKLDPMKRSRSSEGLATYCRRVLVPDIGLPRSPVQPTLATVRGLDAKQYSFR